MILPIKDKFISAISKQTGFIQDIGKRLRVESDLDTFNYKEDKSIWHQKRGDVARYYTVYFDDVFILGFEDTELPEATFLRFFRALHELARQGKVVLDKYKAKEEQMIAEELTKQAKKEKQKLIDDLPEDTKEHSMAKEVIKRVNRRVSTKRQQ